MTYVTDLDTPLLKLSATDTFSLRDACNGGVHVFGSTGSGKTSGSGKALASALLRAGVGALICAAKYEDVKLWREYAAANGRTASLIEFDETQGFNFINYLLSSGGKDGVRNAVEAMLYLMDVANSVTGGGGQDGEKFWRDSMRQILSYLLPAVYTAYGTVSIASIIEFMSSAATTADQYVDDAWCKTSYAAKTLTAMVESPVNPMEDADRDICLQYWFHQYTAIPSKTRGNIVISLSSTLDRFQHGRLKRCFCDKTTIVPEMAFGGGLILMCMPAMTWHQDGIIGQLLFKYMFQRAAEARNSLDPSQRDRALLLWCDESQFFTTEKDSSFLSTCRSSKVCVVYMTQTLPTYYAQLGQNKTDAANAIVGKFNTQIFHQNSCFQTNEFASKLIGRDIWKRRNEGYSFGSNESRNSSDGLGTSHGSSGSHTTTSGGGMSSSGGWNSGTTYNHSDGQSRGSSENWSQGSSEQMDNLIEPNFFAQHLKSGGPRNKGIVSAVWFKAGAKFDAGGGRNFMVVEFKQ